MCLGKFFKKLAFVMYQDIFHWLASEVPSYRLLCAFAGKNEKSICEESDDEKLAQVISKAYLDRPTGDPYSFQLNPPKLTGQIGVPLIVDKLLGTIIK